MFQFPFYFKSFKRDIIVLISFLILFVSISFLVNIGKDIPFRGSVNTYVQTLVRRQVRKCAGKFANAQLSFRNEYLDGLTKTALKEISQTDLSSKNVCI